MSQVMARRRPPLTPPCPGPGALLPPSVCGVLSVPCGHSDRSPARLSHSPGLSRVTGSQGRPRGSPGETPGSDVHSIPVPELGLPRVAGRPRAGARLGWGSPKNFSGLLAERGLGGALGV